MWGVCMWEACVGRVCVVCVGRVCGGGIYRWGEKTDYVQVCRRTHYSNNLECYDTVQYQLCPTLHRNVYPNKIPVLCTHQSLPN